MVDRTIKIWDMETGAQRKSLTGHARGIACIQFDGDTIVSGSSGIYPDHLCSKKVGSQASCPLDTTIKIWDVHTGAQLLTISGHTDLVRTLQFNDVRIVSGSYDETLKVWDRRTGGLLLDTKGEGHTSRVFKLQFNTAKIVSCSQDQVCVSLGFHLRLDSNLQSFD